MTRATLNRAKRLADRPYSTQLMLDTTVDGKPVYVASHPELPGCIAQGNTVEEAISDLYAATVEFIASLLEDGLSIAAPTCFETTTSLGESSQPNVSFVAVSAPEPADSPLQALAGGTFSLVRA